MTACAEWLDGDGYPTEAALHRIEQWPHMDSAGALAFIAGLWAYPENASFGELEAHEAAVLHADPGEQFWRFATGGWSGNEDLLRAFGRNRIAYGICWRLSTASGLHVFSSPHARRAE